MGRGERGKTPPLDEGSLERLALRYAERYATSRAKLARYLLRKTRERGWTGLGDAQDAPPIEAIVERMAGLGYVDDRAFATARGTTLTRRGLGVRRVAADLRAAGVGEEDSNDARAAAVASALAAALRYAQKRKIGPFALATPDRAGRDRALAALLRAGHPIDLARRIVAAVPGDELDDFDT